MCRSHTTKIHVIGYCSAALHRLDARAFKWSASKVQHHIVWGAFKSLLFYRTALGWLGLAWTHPGLFESSLMVSCLRSSMLPDQPFSGYLPLQGGTGRMRGQAPGRMDAVAEESA